MGVDEEGVDEYARGSLVWEEMGVSKADVSERTISARCMACMSLHTERQQEVRIGLQQFYVVEDHW